MSEPKDDPIEELLAFTDRQKETLEHTLLSKAAPAIRALQERVKELEGKQFIFDDQGNSRECNLMNDSEIRVKFMDLIRENNQLNAKLAWFEDNKVPKEPLEAKLARVIEAGKDLYAFMHEAFPDDPRVKSWLKAIAE